jgi:hypothetical protein
MVSGFNAKWTDSTGSQIKTTPSNSAAPIALQIGPQIGCSSQRVELQVGVPQAVCTGSMNTETVSNKKRFIFWNKKEQNVTVSYFIATVVAQRAGQLLANEGFDDKAMSKISKNSNWEKSLSLYDLLDKALINQVHIVPSLGRPSILPSSQDAFIVFGINPNLLSKNLLKQKVEIQLSQDFQDGKNPPEVISRTIESLALNGLSTPKKVTKILKQESDNDVTYLIRLKSSPKEAVRVKLTINPGARDFDTELERQ